MSKSPIWVGELRIMREKMKVIAFGLIIGSYLTAGGTQGQNSEPAALLTGAEIIARSHELSSGFGTEMARVRLTTTNARGKSSVREFRIKIREGDDDDDRSLIRFLAPADIRGLAFLSHGHANRSDDQWLYLPRMKRTKRIAARKRSGSFAGSAFSLEDMGVRNPDNFDYKLAGEEPLDGAPCFLVESRPKSGIESGYGFTRLWLAKDNYQARQVHYFNRKGKLIKIAYISGYEQVAGKYWRPGKIVMENLRRKMVSTFEVSEREIGVELRTDDLMPRSLERGP